MMSERAKVGQSGAWPDRQPCECVECIMAWLLLGDGAECLAGHGRVYWKKLPPVPPRDRGRA